MNSPGTCHLVRAASSRSAASNRPILAPQGRETQDVQTAAPAHDAPPSPTKSPAAPRPERTRLRLRFRKMGVMRLLGHHDLVRTWERAFRRAGLPLRMSQGFHPKPRLSFPAALALGVAGLDEVLEAELDSALAPHEVWQRLAVELPPGLELVAIERLPERGRAARMLRAHYIFPLPPTRRAAAAAAAARMRDAASTLLGQSAERSPADLRAGLTTLEVRGGVLRFCIAPGGETPVTAGSSTTGTTRTPRPHEVLAALGLDDLLSGTAYLTRTSVELAPCEPESPQPLQGRP